jgi:hypothetical protein
MTLAVIDRDFDGCSWRIATITFPEAASARSIHLLLVYYCTYSGHAVATEWWDTWPGASLAGNGQAGRNWRMQVVRACTTKRQRELGSCSGSCVHSTLGAACRSRQVAHDGTRRLREVQLGRERPRHPHLRAENGQTCVATVAR